MPACRRRGVHEKRRLPVVQAVVRSEQPQMHGVFGRLALRRLRHVERLVLCQRHVHEHAYCDGLRADAMRSIFRDRLCDRFDNDRWRKDRVWQLPEALGLPRGEGLLRGRLLFAQDLYRCHRLRIGAVDVHRKQCVFAVQIRC